jgi:chromosomal replication initiation ATPase DnaA
MTDDARQHSTDNQNERQHVALRDGFATVSPRDFTLALVGGIARKHGVSVEDIRGPDRHRTVMLARCEAIRAIGKARPNWSYPEIGRFFGGRDHTSIMHHYDKRGQGRQTCSCDKVKARLNEVQTDPEPHPETLFMPEEAPTP